MHARVCTQTHMYATAHTHLEVRNIANICYLFPSRGLKLDHHLLGGAFTRVISLAHALKKKKIYLF